MKKVIAILMMMFSAFFLLMFLIMTLVLLSEFSLSTFIFLIFILFIPGGLLLIGSIKLLESSKKAATQRSAQNLSWQSTQSDSGTSFNPFDAASVNDFVQEQLKHGDTKTVKTSNGSTQTVFTTTSSTTSSSSDVDGQQFNEVFNSFFGGQGGFTAGAVAPKDPVSVDCPGCGSKTTVYPTQSTNCEFCGTVVHYQEK
ncbi:ABC-type multidrug transport system fused ATPase/permease subunit [Paenibacillus anaericanus]|uniref:TFIIB-type zinc ribbon-containing protein n=1 Tax=Paenibacillus anaericanus TaxID=170367 RepID=UPI00278692E6|nr:TFIIB-type zinc ribbon-containing protein [Paenibacillus anaericanus]MDQ0087944.1 ABC-type multidrug transport system fused ATPase/permease subunit [Paenibacillus anaericanus]